MIIGPLGSGMSGAVNARIKRHLLPPTGWRILWTDRETWTPERQLKEFERESGRKPPKSLKRKMYERNWREHNRYWHDGPAYPHR